MYFFNRTLIVLKSPAYLLFFIKKAKYWMWNFWNLSCIYSLWGNLVARTIDSLVHLPQHITLILLKHTTKTNRFVRNLHAFCAWCSFDLIDQKLSFPYAILLFDSIWVILFFLLLMGLLFIYHWFKRWVEFIGFTHWMFYKSFTLRSHYN